MAGGPFGAYGHSAHHHHHHHHHGAPGKQLLSGQFMSEGLRQQLQQANYLTQLQVRQLVVSASVGHAL
jgi:hypothetical protein